MTSESTGRPHDDGKAPLDAAAQPIEATAHRFGRQNGSAANSLAIPRTRLEATVVQA